GKTVVYQVEGGAPNALFRNGWRPDTLKIGETVTVTGSRAKSEDSMRVGSATITRGDGTRVFGGAAAADNSSPQRHNDTEKAASRIHLTRPSLCLCVSVVTLLSTFDRDTSTSRSYRHQDRGYSPRKNIP